MARRLNTIIIVPHSKAKFIKFSFSNRTLVIGSLLAVAAVVFSIVAIAYTGSAVNRRAEVQRLRTENSQLAEVNHALEKTVTEVQGRLDEFEERTARLALAAGMPTDGADVVEMGNGSERTGTGGPYDRLPDSPDQLALQGEWIGRQLDEVEKKILRDQETLACTPTIAPVIGLITDGYGRRKDPFTGRQAFHPGLDLSARRGTPVVAPADGVVVFAGRNGGLGKVVRLSHGFGYTTVFGHLDKVLVEAGTEVQRGDEVGLLGNTGRSTGPHLHYEVHQDGKAVNPLYYILDAF